MKIASIDFETANDRRTSMCAASVAVFENGKLVESPYWLVKPPKGHGWFIPEWTRDIHGLSWFDVQDAPEFPQIATAFLELLTSADIVIAHYARFDMEVLMQTLDHFQLPKPTFRYLCTCTLARRVWPELPNHRLNTLAAHIGCELQHHHAQSDAVAAGRVMLAAMSQLHVSTIQDLANLNGMQMASVVRSS